MHKFWIVGMMLLCGVSVQAGEIVAIVNDRPISDFDVLSRAKMLQLQQFGKVSVVTDKEKKLALEDLIDEQIKHQEVVKKGIQISEEEIKNAIAHLEQQNGLKAGGFASILSSQKIPYQTLVKQTQANLGWMRLLQMSGRKIPVSNADIDMRKKALRQDLGQDSYVFGEIVVKTEAEALDILKRLQSGADFETMVGLNSISDSRLNGGRVIGAHRDYYGEKVAPILEILPVGQISRPVRVSEGYALILMMKKQKAIKTDTVKVWDLAQAIISANQPLATALAQSDLNTCEGFLSEVKSAAVPESIERGIVAPEQLPEDMSLVLKDAPFKKVLGPMITPMGNLYFMKCQASEQRVIPTDDELKMQLDIEKMELLSRQMLSELKRDVVIEYK